MQHDQIRADARNATVLPIGRGAKTADRTKGELVAERGPDGSVELSSMVDGTTLTFTEAEWNAFRSGVEAGEFGRFLG